MAQEDIERMPTPEYYKFRYQPSNAEAQAFASEPKKWMKEFLEKRGLLVNTVTVVPSPQGRSLSDCLSPLLPTNQAAVIIIHTPDSDWIII